MKVKSFIFGLGCGLMLLSVFFYFVYGSQKGSVRVETVAMSDDEVKERAKALGMVSLLNDAERGRQDDYSNGDSNVNAIENNPEVLPGVTENEPENNSIEPEGTGDENTRENAEGNTAETAENTPEASETVQNEPNPPEVVTVPEDEIETVPNETNASEPETAHNENPAEVENPGDENGPPANETIFMSIPRGLHARDIAEMLYNAGIINNANEFLTYLKENNLTTRLIYGNYRFYPDESFESVAGKLTS